MCARVCVRGRGRAGVRVSAAGKRTTFSPHLRVNEWGGGGEGRGGRGRDRKNEREGEGVRLKESVREGTRKKEREGGREVERATHREIEREVGGESERGETKGEGERLRLTERLRQIDT